MRGILHAGERYNVSAQAAQRHRTVTPDATTPFRVCGVSKWRNICMTAWCRCIGGHHLQALGHALVVPPWIVSPLFDIA